MFNCTTIRFQPRNLFKSFILEKIRRKKSIWVNLRQNWGITRSLYFCQTWKKMILYYLKKVKTIMNERSNAIRIICIISSDANIRTIYNILIYVNKWVLSPSYTTVFLNHTAKKTQSNRQRRFNTEQKRTNRKRRGFSEWISEIINI